MSNEREDNILLVEHRRWQADHDQREKHYNGLSSHWRNTIIIAIGGFVLSGAFKVAVAFIEKG